MYRNIQFCLGHYNSLLYVSIIIIYVLLLFLTYFHFYVYMFITCVFVLIRVKILLEAAAECSPVSPCVPWDQVILACVEHMITTVPQSLKAGVVSELKFYPPFGWQRATAETALALTVQEQKNRDIKDRSKRRRSNSVVTQEPASSRLRLNLGSSMPARDDLKLLMEGHQLVSSLSNEAALSKS